MIIFFFKLNAEEGHELKKKTLQFKLKTLRVGWLHKSSTDKKYVKVRKPVNGIIKLKLDESLAYTADEIRKMAVKKLESEYENFAMEDKFNVNLGFFGGRVIYNFKLRDDIVCDVWNYCKLKRISLYNLNIFLLTTPKNLYDDDPFKDLKIIESQKSNTNILPKKITNNKKTKKRKKRVTKVKDDFRIYYHYSRTSKYTNETTFTECVKEDLHLYFLENNFGDGPLLEDYEPLEFGHNISRIEKEEKVFIQIFIDEFSKKSFEFPSAKLPVEPHSVVHDTDELQGIYDGKFGIGFVPSCINECRPIFEWYRDDVVYKKGDHLYWLKIHNSTDDQTHVWYCIVTCQETHRKLRSKDIKLDKNFKIVL